MKQAINNNNLLSKVNHALASAYERFIGHWLLACVLLAFVLFGELGLIFALLVTTIIVALRVNFYLYWRPNKIESKVNIKRLIMSIAGEASAAQSD